MQMPMRGRGAPRGGYPMSRGAPYGGGRGAPRGGYPMSRGAPYGGRGGMPPPPAFPGH